MTQLEENITPGVAELLSIFDQQTSVKRGYVTAPAWPNHADNKENIQIYYELHGTKTPDENTSRIVFVGGLNNSCFAYLPQVQYFAARPNTQILVYDNRGVGYSSSPWGFYSTSLMAQDLFPLLESLGPEWTKDRSIHLIGHSMGGMIAQEIALRIPKRIISLMLSSTTGGSDGFEMPSGSSIWLFGQILIAGSFKSPQAVVALVLGSLFPQEYLESPDPKNESKRIREKLEAHYIERIRVTRPQVFAGKLGQMAAALTHSLSPEKRRQLSSSMPAISILAGDKDQLVNYKRTIALHTLLEGSQLDVYEGGGHSIGMQDSVFYNGWMERSMSRGIKRVAEDFEA